MIKHTICKKKVAPYVLTIPKPIISIVWLGSDPGSSFNPILNLSVGPYSGPGFHNRRINRKGPSFAHAQRAAEIADLIGKLSIAKPI